MSWTVQQAKDVYGIEHWGDGYFDIDPQGRVVAYPRRDADAGSVDLFEVARMLRSEGLSLPVLVRFKDILQDRAARLFTAFGQARAEFGYQGSYTPVYPIKVNQERHVIEGILGNGANGVGLEAGSKSELLAILALANTDTIVCNGYKDRAYIRLALIGLRLGLNVFIVIEKLSELAIILAEAQALGVTPQLGVRVRLASISAGKWQNSGGEKSKFGLSASDILRLLEALRSAGGLSWLRLMHFHMGSQIGNISDIKSALREAGRYYAELRALGADLTHVDLGGGLGVDYEGSRSASFCSINYSMDEYAHSIVRAFSEICAEHALPHPHLITESGRAMTAHHAVLITNVIDIETVPEQVPAAAAPEAQVVKDLADLLTRLPHEPVLGIYHDAQFDLQDARARYVQGQLSLTELAAAERLGAAISHGVRKRLDLRLRAHWELLNELNERLADKLFCNFSLFQSMPDSWAIDQIFPIMPLHRLNEEPTRRAVLQDLTCDSDGHVDAYIDRQSIEKTLAVHEQQAGADYLLGFFLLGAYQEILGDMHNLFGDTHAINVELDNRGGYRLVQAVRGDGADDVLRYVHIEPDELETAFRKRLADADIGTQERRLFESELMAGLSAYTYLGE
ncbi:MAG: biosynthetic arginine decarboxylase [Methylococcaceae bacterium]|nr:MAG: biosynthetic arginine decarboxylase [Methylococcaceae bacterium]